MRSALQKQAGQATHSHGRSLRLRLIDRPPEYEQLLVQGASIVFSSSWPRDMGDLPKNHSVLLTHAEGRALLRETSAAKFYVMHLNLRLLEVELHALGLVSQFTRR